MTANINPLSFFLLGFLIVSVCPDDGSLVPTDLFVGFFPCVPDLAVNMSTQEDAQNCDLFVYAAVQLALERVESELENDQRRVSSSIVTEDNSESEETDVIQVLYNFYEEVNKGRREFPESLSVIRGIIGTDNNYVQGVSVISIAHNIGIPIVSYGLSDDRLNQYSMFYRTIPSTPVLNQARLRLLFRFEWYRIGILGSSQKQYKYQMESFREFFNLSLEKEVQAELSYIGTTSDLHMSLSDLHRLGIRIILAFFGPTEMRSVLCEASSKKYNLTTSDHVWILPSYYSPDWWKRHGSTFSSAQQSKNCTDEEMANILQSVLFLDPVKYPPLETSLSEFYPALLNKTREVFSQLSPEVKLEPLLQHSRAVSAYDSTLLLSRSLIGGRINTSRLHSQIVCELCRIYPEQFYETEMDLLQCSSILLACRDSTMDSNDAELIRLAQNVTRDTALTVYGQVLITQFINGTHCPMALLLPTNSSSPNKTYISVSSLSNFSGPLKLDPKIVFPNTIDCPDSFYWKGRETPPTANVVLNSSISVEALAIVGVVTGLSEILMISFIVFSIVWRKNIHVKSTSPRINILMLVGAAIYSPFSVIEGIILSANRYNLQESLATTLCQFNLWIPSIGITLVMTGLLVKIFRLYRIFRNTLLRIKLSNHLHDRDLIIGAFILALPVIILLTVWTAIPDTIVKLFRDYADNGNIQYIQITKCRSERTDLQYIFEALKRIYLTAVFLTAICLSLFITGAPKSIRTDISITRVALGVGSLGVISTTIAEVIAVDSPLLYEIVWWFRVLDVVFGTTAVMTLLISYQVVLVARDYRKKIKEKCVIKMAEKYPKCHSHVTLDPDTYYRSLLKEITELSSSLAEKEAEIRQLKAQKQVLGDLNVKTSTDKVGVKLVT